jgi:tryptophan synthase alpha chain
MTVMVSRISETFARLKQARRTGLVTYVTAGDPDMERSAAILRALDRARADVIEVGVPFSDPLADGPVIQRATERALAAGANLTAILDMLDRVRSTLSVPIVLFTYANPLLRMGLSTFGHRAVQAGVDGVLVLDLPIEEAGECRETMSVRGIDTIFLLSPTTTRERIRKAAQLGSGFLYGISRLGVTGVRDQVAPGARELVERIRRETAMPVALGFGISRPEHVRQIGQWAEAAVVGSGLVEVIAQHRTASELVDRVESYVRWLKGDA